MTVMLEEMMADLAKVRAIVDPAERAVELTRIIRDLPKMAAEIRAERQAAFNELQQAGWSHKQLGELVGVARNRAAQISGGVPGGKRRRDVAAEPDEGVEPG